MKNVKLTPDEAAEFAVWGMFGEADLERAERFEREGNLEAAKREREEL